MPARGRDYYNFRFYKKIIGEWINGSMNGYSFGFEGPPGVGKTSLANEGITKCLKDKDGNNRPFSFIAIGGSSNGSTLQGHNYTYVGSTWGKIQPTWHHIKQIWGQLGANLWPTWGNLGPTWGQVRPTLCQLCANFGHFATNLC